MHFNFLPIAFSIKTAATEESTPPESPNITFLSLTISFIFFISYSIKEFIFQFFLHLQISNMKFFIILIPFFV